jgi:hypothetical protein
LSHDRRVINRTLRLLATAGAELVAARTEGRDVPGQKGRAVCGVR